VMVRCPLPRIVADPNKPPHCARFVPNDNQHTPQPRARHSRPCSAPPRPRVNESPLLQIPQASEEPARRLAPLSTWNPSSICHMKAARAAHHSDKAVAMLFTQYSPANSPPALIGTLISKQSATAPDILPSLDDLLALESELQGIQDRTLSKKQKAEKDRKELDGIWIRAKEKAREKIRERQQAREKAAALEGEEKRQDEEKERIKIKSIKIKRETSREYIYIYSYFHVFLSQRPIQPRV